MRILNKHIGNLKVSASNCPTPHTHNRYGQAGQPNRITDNRNDFDKNKIQKSKIGSY